MKKQNSGGEASKRAKAMSKEERDEHTAAIADAREKKEGNIGPSGQGSHRGKERQNRQSMASGRPDVGSAGSRPKHLKG